MNKTLNAFLEEYSSNAALNDLLLALTEAALRISALLRRGNLDQLYGANDEINVQGEAQQKLDALSNEILLDIMGKHPHCAAMATEEMEDVRRFRDDASFLLALDPLDGSSNIALNLPTGTIFSVLAHPRYGEPARWEDFLQAGKSQLAAGYFLYGSALILTLTLGFGTFSFTWDEKQQQWRNQGDALQIPPQAKEFAINMAYALHWAEPVKRYIATCQQGKNGAFGRDYNMRWLGAMVGDVHRILTRGGVFLYPWDDRSPERAGKLRLLYELNPMSFLVEQAGGSAINAQQRILDLQPQNLHQREAIMLGARDDIALLQQWHHESNAETQH